MVRISLGLQVYFCLHELEEEYDKWRSLSASELPVTRRFYTDTHRKEEKEQKLTTNEEPKQGTLLLMFTENHSYEGMLQLLAFRHVS